MRARLRTLTVLAVGAFFLAGCSTDQSGAGSGGGPSAAGAPSVRPGPAPSRDPVDVPGSPAPTTSDPPARPVSVLGLGEQRHRGDRLRLGAVRERTPAYTSYDVTYRSRSTTPRGEEAYRISGVLDPAVYVRGQGMTRERGYLASRGYVALHVDYRNHAESDDDPLFQVRMRLGYSADVINAVKALRASADVPVDDDRVALFGRSMGGGVIM